MNDYLETYFILIDRQKTNSSMLQIVNLCYVNIKHNLVVSVSSTLP